jgi:hypothetical protein
MVRPVETVSITATLDETLSNAFYLSAVVRVGKEVAVRLSYACSLAPKAS